MINAMITYRFKAETSRQHISFVGQKIEYRALRREIAHKTGTKDDELIMYYQQSNIKIKDGDYIKAFSSIVVERSNPLSMNFLAPQTTKPLPTQTKVSGVGNSWNTIDQGTKEQFNQMLDSAKYFMIKSSNEANVQRAKDQSIWATTLVNQRKLKMAFDDSPHVILFFKAGSSNNLHGVARMEDKPSDIPNKNSWLGVETIKLGGNFKIKWISKSVVVGARYENQINVLTREYMSRSGDMTEIDKELGKKMFYLFDIQKDQQTPFVPPKIEQKIIDMNQILKLSANNPPLQPPSTIHPPFGPPPPPPHTSYGSIPIPMNPHFPFPFGYPPILPSSQAQKTSQFSSNKQSNKERKSKRRSRSRQSSEYSSSSSSESSRERDRSRRKDKERERGRGKQRQRERERERERGREKKRDRKNDKSSRRRSDSRDRKQRSDKHRDRKKDSYRR